MPAPTPQSIRQFLRTALPSDWTGPDTFGHFKRRDTQRGKLFRIKVQDASLRFEVCDKLPRYEGAGMQWIRLAGCPLSRVTTSREGDKTFLIIGGAKIPCLAIPETVPMDDFSDFDQL